MGRSMVYEVARRFREQGEAGLVDHREENGGASWMSGTGCALRSLKSSPQEHWRRPTWTRDTLVATLCQKTGVRIHVATMSKALKRSGRGEASESDRELPLVEIGEKQAFAGTPPLSLISARRGRRVRGRDRHPLESEDWPGLDGPGPAEEDPHAATNEKRYLPGPKTPDRRNRFGGKREKQLPVHFLLWELVKHYPDAKTIQVILDNYAIHTTEQVEVSLQSNEGRRLRLHFLPPYCPDHNKIERTWQDLHANVTRNHTRTTMNRLMQDVRSYLRRRNHQQQTTTAA